MFGNLELIETDVKLPDKLNRAATTHDLTLPDLSIILLDGYYNLA